MAITPLDRLEALEAAVLHLRETADPGTVVVEGARDAAALESLGIGGRHYRIHQGRPMAAVLEDLARSPPPIVLLVDWDRTGGRLVRSLEENLRGRTQVDTECRRRLALAAHARCVEDLPAELASLRGL